MPEKETIRRAKKAAREGKAPTTQAGEFVREEIRHVRSGKHRVRSLKQALAIALSKARRAGIKLARPFTTKKRSSARAASEGNGVAKTQTRRGRSTESATKRESMRAVSRRSLSRHAQQTARKRGAAARSRSAKKAVRTKGTAGLRRAARKAAATRARQH